MQFEQLMRDRDPVVEVPALTPAERRMIATRAMGTGAAQPQERHPRALRWTAAAAALVIGGTLFGVQAMNAVAPASAAQKVLQEASINATDEPASASQYWQITSVGYSVVSVGYDVETPGDPAAPRFYSITDDRRDWVAVDGTRPNWTEVSDHKLLDQIAGPQAEYALSEKQAAGGAFTSNIAPVDLSPETTWFEPFGISPTWLDSLPTNVNALGEELRRTAPANGDAALFEHVSRILTSSLADAELRRALFGVLEGLPNIKISQEEVTLDGRTGVGLALTDQPDRGTVLVVNPEGGDVIGRRNYQRIPELPGAPVIVMSQLAISKTLVDDIPPNVRNEAAVGNCTIGPVEGSCDFSE